MRNVLTMKYPASWHGNMWREAIPVGNGAIGALVYGGAYKEIIAINHSELWYGAQTPPMPDVSDTLATMRKLLNENKPVEAERVMANAFNERGYSPKTAMPLPLCDIEFVTDNKNGFKNYLRSLDMEKAEATVSCCDGDTNIKRNFFVSRSDDTCYLNVSADNGKIDADVTLKIHDVETLRGKEPPENAECTASDGMIFFAAHSEGKDFGAVLKLCHDGTESCKDGVISVTGATYIFGALKVFIYSERAKEFEKLKNSFENKNYLQALSEHCAIHGELFNRQTLSLGGSDYSKSNEEMLLDAYSGEASTELIEKLWSFGRYLLICASKPNGLPCQLYGVWTGGYREWWAFNMFNVNVEMIYWQALSGGMFEVLRALFDYLKTKLGDYRENAEKLFGCRGINIPSVSTPESGLHKCLYPHILHWTGAAAWMAQFYYDYFRYSGDTEFLKNEALPFMKETVLFYEDYLFEDENGKYVFSPSNSPENTPKNVFDEVRRNCEVAVNATMDIALFKEVTSNLVSGAEFCGMYGDEIAKWKKMLSKLPQYEINEDGAIKEWTSSFYTDNYEHRHQSHVYPVFPGYEFTRDDGGEYYKAFEKAIELRQTVGLKDQSGWSLAYMSNVYARMGRGDDAVNCIDLITRSVILPNLFSVHNDWRRMGVAVCNDLREAPVQLDADMGVTAAINEMLVFSTPNKIYLFNALPKRFVSGSYDNVYTRTGCRVSLEWNEHGARAVVRHGGQSKEVKLILPSNMRFKDNNSNRISITSECEKTFEFEIEVI